MVLLLSVTVKGYSSPPSPNTKRDLISLVPAVYGSLQETKENGKKLLEVAPSIHEEEH